MMLIAKSILKALVLALAILILFLNDVHVANGIEPHCRRNVAVIDLIQPRPAKQGDFGFIFLSQCQQFLFVKIAFAAHIIVPVPGNKVRRCELIVVKRQFSLEFLFALDPVVKCKSMFHDEPDINRALASVTGIRMFDDIADATGRFNVTHAFQKGFYEVEIHELPIVQIRSSVICGGGLYEVHTLESTAFKHTGYCKLLLY